jgi:hypothetical protein
VKTRDDDLGIITIEDERDDGTVVELQCRHTTLVVPSFPLDPGDYGYTDRIMSAMRPRRVFELTLNTTNVHNRRLRIRLDQFAEMAARLQGERHIVLDDDAARRWGFKFGPDFGPDFSLD